jgi:hypothetical protein
MTVGTVTCYISDATNGYTVVLATVTKGGIRGHCSTYFTPHSVTELQASPGALVQVLRGPG